MTKRLEELSIGEAWATFQQQKKIMAQSGMTNQLFSMNDKTFLKACKAAKIKPSSRQASKYQNKKGIAWKVAHIFGTQPISETSPDYFNDLSAAFQQKKQETLTQSPT